MREITNTKPKYMWERISEESIRKKWGVNG